MARNNDYEGVSEGDVPVAGGKAPKRPAPLSPRIKPADTSPKPEPVNNNTSVEQQLNAERQGAPAPVPVAPPPQRFEQAEKNLVDFMGNVKGMQTPTLNTNVQPITVPTMGAVQMGAAPTVQLPGQGPQTAQVGPTQVNSQFRDVQGNLVNALQAQAFAPQGSPEYQSLAQLQLQQGMDKGIAASQAQLASQRGGFDPAAFRNAQQSQQEMVAQTQMASAQTAAQEQYQQQQIALQRGQLQLGQQELAANVVGQARQGDFSQADLQQQAAIKQAELAQSSFLADYQAKVQAGQTDAQIASQFGLSLADLQQKRETANFTAQVNAFSQAQNINADLSKAFFSGQMQMEELKQRIYLDALKTGLSIEEARLKALQAERAFGIEDAKLNVERNKANNASMGGILGAVGTAAAAIFS